MWNSARLFAGMSLLFLSAMLPWQRCFSLGGDASRTVLGIAEHAPHEHEEHQEGVTCCIEIPLDMQTVASSAGAPGGEAAPAAAVTEFASQAQSGVLQLPPLPPRPHRPLSSVLLLR